MSDTTMIWKSPSGMKITVNKSEAASKVFTVHNCRYESRFFTQKVSTKEIEQKGGTDTIV